MKKRILNILVVILTIGVIYEISSYFIIKSNNKVLEDIKTVDTFDNKDKTLSIMIQQDNFNYKEDTSRTTWPSRDEYLYTGSKCVDKDNKDLGDSTKYISFEETSPNPTVTIKTNKTIYCTLYFAKGRPALEVLDKQGGDYYAGGGEHTAAVDGLYRFKGTASQVTNNYICLGDENPDTCKTNKENMYRIIGVTTDGKLKVIKASKYGENQVWGANNSTTKWNNSSLKTYINGTFYNSIDARIQGLIEYHTWNMEYQDSSLWPSSSPTSDSIKDGTVSSYIGLMYATDYVNAGSNIEGNQTNWLFLMNGWSGNINEYEWTMTMYGIYKNSPRVWYVMSNGTLSNGQNAVYQPLAIRPVFYLLSITGLIGFGTANQPYTVTSIK